MSVPRVKICGLRSLRDLEIAIEAGTDAIGVICNVPVDSPREISVQTATSIVRAAPPFVATVLVTMPTTVEETLDLVEAVDPTAIQLHTALPPEDVIELRNSVSVIQALDPGDEGKIQEYADIADAILLDSTDEAGAGGTGRTHDWDRAREVVESVDCPVVLAGGLAPANVRSAVDRVGPFAVDVASGVEHGGEKDRRAIHQFVANATGQPIRAGET